MTSPRILPQNYPFLRLLLHHLPALPSPSLIHLRYIAYTKLYLDTDIAVGVRGFCELRLTRLGEALYMPVASRLTLVRSDERLAAMERRSDMAHLFAIAAGAKPVEMLPAALPEVSAAETFAAAVAATASIGVGGALLDANGQPVYGPDGKPMFATDERVPPGGTIGAGGVILDKNGHLCMGPDGKPMVVTIAAAQAFADPERAEAEGPAAAADFAAATTTDVPGETPAAAESVDAPAADEPRPEAPKTEVPKPPLPKIVSPPSAPASQAIGSVKQYARKHDGSSSSPKQMIGKITAAFSRSPGPATTPTTAQPEKREQKRFEIPPPATGPSIVTGEGLGGQGHIYETTEDGQLIIPGNWFEKYKQREYLGGMMRTPAQLKQLALHDQLAAQVASAGKSAAKQHSVIETEGTDSRPMPTYQTPKEWEAMQEQVVGELSAFLSGPGNVRSKLKTTAVQRAVPWQDQISANPQSLLKPTKPETPMPLGFVNA